MSSWGEKEEEVVGDEGVINIEVFSVRAEKSEANAVDDGWIVEGGAWDVDSLWRILCLHIYISIL